MLTPSTVVRITGELMLTRSWAGRRVWNSAATATTGKQEIHNLLIMPPPYSLSDHHYCKSQCWCQHNISKGDRAVVSLQHKRSGFSFVTVQSSSRDTGDFLLVNHRRAIQYYGDGPPHQGYLIGLPLPGFASGVYDRIKKAINSTDKEAARLLSEVILDLEFIPPAQVDAAIAFLGIAKLQTQLEILEFLFGNKVGSSFGISKYAVFDHPIIGHIRVTGLPAFEVRLNQLDRLTPLRHPFYP